MPDRMRLPPVLNAFRHQRKERFRFLSHTLTRYMCSTPFGINGRNASRAAGSGDQVDSAQRLSASTEGTHDCRGKKWAYI